MTPGGETIVPDDNKSDYLFFIISHGFLIEVIPIRTRKKTDRSNRIFHTDAGGALIKLFCYVHGQDLSGNDCL